MSTFTYPDFTAKTPITSTDGYKCPSCGHRLNPENAGKTYRCYNNHSFDRASEGYLNLLLAQHKRSRNPGDSDEMIRSRQRFLNRGYYNNLALHISQQLSIMALNCRVLDIGCGEGFYLQAISAARDDLQLVGVDISKHQQQSDWGAKKLTAAQLDYAASDVLYLHKLRDAFDVMLAREGRTEMAQACFDFLPMRAQLDLKGWPETDIFAHS